MGRRGLEVADRRRLHEESLEHRSGLAELAGVHEHLRELASRAVGTWRGVEVHGPVEELALDAAPAAERPVAELGYRHREDKGIACRLGEADPDLGVLPGIADIADEV